MANNNRLCTIWCGLASSDRYKTYVVAEDLEIFRRRCANEGAEYYARGFTSLRSSLLAGVETGTLEVEDQARQQCLKNTKLPRFLYKAWSAVFNDDGTFKPNYESDAVSCLNQLLAVFGKIEGGHTKESEVICLARFQETEDELRSSHLKLDALLPTREGLLRPGFIKVQSIVEDASKLLKKLLSRVDPRDIKPKHGSGTSACGLPVRVRYGKPRFVNRINELWPYDSFYFLGAAHLADVCSSKESIAWIGGPSQGFLLGRPWTENKYLSDLEEYEPCAKILVVPKDARGPRIISCEPRETMWIQQGLMTSLVDVAEQHSLTRGSVLFTDQKPNQRAAYLGSTNRELSTLDLKDASDRIRLDLVEHLFPRNWYDALYACRSAKTQLPDGTVVELLKHAPMGSATCFPVMALCIWSLLTAALPTGSKILVYGDDIVVPSVFVPRAIAVLEAVGLLVNRSKSFVKGPFRESCGKEYIDGVDITPVRLRSNPDDDIPSRMKLIAFHNNVYRRNLVQPDWLTNLIHSWYPNVPEKSTKVHMAVLLPGGQSLFCRLDDEQTSALMWDSLSPVLDVYRADNQRLRSRWNPELHRREFRCLTVVQREVKYRADRWSQVFRAVVNPRKEKAFGWDALAKRVDYKYRWLDLR